MELLRNTIATVVVQMTTAPVGGIGTIFSYKGDNSTAAIAGTNSVLGNLLIISLTAADTDTLGRLNLYATDGAGTYFFAAPYFDVVTQLGGGGGPVDLGSILGTAVTEGAAGRLAGAFTKLLDVATPTGTVNSLPDAAPGANNGLPILGTNALTQSVAVTNTGGNQAITITSSGDDAILVQTAGTNKNAIRAVSTGSGFGFNGTLSGVASLPTALQNADALLDRADAIETGLTPRQCLRLLEAALAGKLAISGNSVLIQNTADTKTRITATTTAAGERTAVSYDVS